MNSVSSISVVARSAITNRISPSCRSCMAAPLVSTATISCLLYCSTCWMIVRSITSLLRTRIFIRYRLHFNYISCLFIYPCLQTVYPIVIFAALSPCRGSSVVEQGTHKPFVGSPNLPLGTHYLHTLSSGFIWLNVRSVCVIIKGLKEMALDRFITLSEAAQRMRTSVKETRWMIKSGKIKGGLLPDGAMVVREDTLPKTEIQI